jgi:stage V sporulation protein B
MVGIVKASLWLTLAELTFNLSGYVIHAFLGRFLGPAEYGRFSLVITLTTMIVILIGRGVPIAMSKYLSEFLDDKGRILTIKRRATFIQIVLVTIITLLYFFLAPVFAKLLGDESLTPLFRISSLIIPTFALASFYIYYFNGLQEFGKQSLLKFIRSIAKVVFIIGLGYYFKTAGAIVGQALAPLSVFIAAYILDPLRKYKKKRNIESKESANLTKKLLNFAWPIILFMLFYELMITIDLYLIKALLGSDSQTGIYNSALTVGRIPYYAFYFLTIILLPKISQSTAKGVTKETKTIMQKTFRFLFMFLIPIITLLSFFSYSAINFFYGSKYLSAGPALSVLAFGLGFLTVFYILTFVLNGAGRNKAPLVIAFIGAILNAILNYIFIKNWGLVGSAWATTITAFIIMTIGLIYASKKITSFIKPVALLKYIIASFIIYKLANIFFSQGKFIFILWSAILFVVYLIILIIIRELKKEDWQFLVKSFKKK